MTPIERAKARATALQTLGVGVQASNKELRAAWKRKAFESHPDRCNGDDSTFQAVRSAYEYLAGDTAQASASQHEPMHRRAVVRTRMEDLSCKEDALSGALADERVQHQATAAEHVPSAVRRRGRRLTYIIRAALEEGTNRVAIPVALSGVTNEEAATVVSFNSPKMGAGKIELPAEIRESACPEARQVRIEFAGDSTCD